MALTLSCPSCRGDLVLDVPDFGTCAGCRGVWITPQALARRGGKLNADLVAVASRDPRTCPTCDTALAVYRSPKLEIDACDSCAGIFLDRGELELLVRSRAAPNAPATHTCDQCRRDVPVPELVILSDATLCALCAERLHRRPSNSSSSSSSSGWDTAANGLSVVEGAFDVVSVLFDIFG